MPRSLHRLVLLCLALAWLLAVPAHAQDKGCAAIVLHGKWGNPQAIAFFGRKLEPVCTSKAIEMPWSERRAYDQPYGAALAEIATQVKAYRAQGYSRVLLVGQSIGANAALAYMAEVGDVDGVVAMAPGHAPAAMYARGIGKEAVDKARELVAAGKGGEMLVMEDLNQGKRRPMKMSAQALLSYFDPEGLGHMPASVARFKKPVPLLWIVAPSDPGREFAFDKAPAHPASKFVAVQADHFGVPDASVPEITAWIKALP